MNDENYSDMSLIINEHTDAIKYDLENSAPTDLENTEHIKSIIDHVISINEDSPFSEKIACRLTELGITCQASDEAIMITEIKRRYKDILNIPYPKTINNWLRGGQISVTNIKNNYDLCFALEMDKKQTEEFFIKCFFTKAFNVKNTIDAVFLYAIYHQKPYSFVKSTLEKSEMFEQQDRSYTATLQISDRIKEINNDDLFLEYISQHCYGKDLWYKRAREEIKSRLANIHKSIENEYHNDVDRKYYTNRLNSLSIEKLIGYKYQQTDKTNNAHVLPKRVTQSMPNDVTLGKILNDDNVTYELLRKTLILMIFYDTYKFISTDDTKKINNTLMDFYVVVDNVLSECGMAQLYVRNPFDCLIMYCANSYMPVETLYRVISEKQN